MAADGTLAEDDQRAGQDVGALDGDADRDLLVGAADEIGRAETDALAADDVHAVIDDLAGTLGDVVFGDGGDDRRLLAEVDGAGGHRARGIHHVGIGADARQRLLDALELADGHLELAAHAGIAADGARRHLGHAGVGRRQRDRAAGSQALHQHAPALAGLLRTADDEVERHEDIGAAHRAVHEHGVEREVAATGIDARMVVGNQRAGDADMLLVAEQALRVIEMEGQAEHGTDRRQRDVALVEGDAHADHFLALVHALADHTGVGDRRGVGAGPRAGQREGGHLDALGQARQVVVLLRFGAVVQEQFGRAERVRHHDRDRQGGGAGRQLGHDLRMRVGGKLEAAVLLRDDHAEEALVLDIAPGGVGQVVELVRHLPVIDQAAGFLDLVVHERLLFGGQLRLRVGMQFLPVGLAAEQFALPPDRAGLERVALRIRHLRQDLAIGRKQRPADHRAADWPHEEQADEARECQGTQQGKDGIGHDAFSFDGLVIIRQREPPVVARRPPPRTAAAAPSGRRAGRTSGAAAGGRSGRPSQAPRSPSL